VARVLAFVVCAVDPLIKKRVKKGNANGCNIVPNVKGLKSTLVDLICTLKYTFNLQVYFKVQVRLNKCTFFYA